MNLVKMCGLIGAFLGVVYAGLVALLPRLPGQPASFFVPEMVVPPEPNVAPGTQPPLGAKLQTMVVLCFFMGPFGALAGTGVGLLLNGAVQIFRKKPGPGEGGRGLGDKPADKSVTEPKGP